MRGPGRRTRSARSLSLSPLLAGRRGSVDDVQGHAREYLPVMHVKPLQADLAGVQAESLVRVFRVEADFRHDLVAVEIVVFFHVTPPISARSFQRPCVASRLSWVAHAAPFARTLGASRPALRGALSR